MRLAQFISRAGWCSRKAASRLIDQQQVRVNDAIAGHLTFVDSDDIIMIATQRLTLPTTFGYVIYHKATGVDCNWRFDDPSSICHQLDFEPRLFAVGRLDKDSHGLLLLTNDGDLCHQLLSPDFNHPKTYLVKVTPCFGQHDIDQTFVSLMSNGIAIKSRITKPCLVKIIAKNHFEITLTEGLNRQIRKMAQSCGYKVIDLQRVELAGISLGDLGVNQWRDLTPVEVTDLKARLVN